jgi:hypothetical protein
MAQFYPQYELTGHLGNVRAVIGDRLEEKTDEDNQTAYKPELLSATDYFPFGMQMPGRVYVNGEGYRYGFQGQESENELYGDGNASFYKYRISNNWNGRFFAVDPLAPEYPWNSPYAFSENRVIDGVELEGLEYVGVNAPIGSFAAESMAWTLGYRTGNMDEQLDKASKQDAAVAVVQVTVIIDMIATLFYPSQYIMEGTRDNIRAIIAKGGDIENVDVSSGLFKAIFSVPGVKELPMSKHVENAAKSYISVTFSKGLYVESSERFEMEFALRTADSYVPKIITGNAIVDLLANDGVDIVKKVARDYILKGPTSEERVFTPVTENNTHAADNVRVSISIPEN